VWLKVPQRIGARLAISHMAALMAAMFLFIAGTSAILFAQMRRQLWHFATQDIETVEGLMSISDTGAFRVRENYHNHPESKRILDRFLEVRSSTGAVLYRNARLGDRSLGIVQPARKLR
jgi:hypothetical protein